MYSLTGGTGGGPSFVGCGPIKGGPLACPQMVLDNHSIIEYKVRAQNFGHRKGMNVKFTMKVALSLISLLLLCTFARGQSDTFTGDWVVRDYKVGGIPDRGDLMDTVTIKSDGNYYYVSGLDARADHMSFIRRGNTLEGRWVADLDYLKEHYDGFPESVLVQANHKVEYHVVISFDGQGLTAKSANASIRYDTDGYYHGYSLVEGYYYWYLTRPKR
jgi:hypothetical protein